VAVLLGADMLSPMSSCGGFVVLVDVLELLDDVDVLLLVLLLLVLDEVEVVGEEVDVDEVVEVDDDVDEEVEELVVVDPHRVTVVVSHAGKVHVIAPPKSACNGASK
jgi:hypothetical protein